MEFFPDSPFLKTIHSSNYIVQLVMVIKMFVIMPWNAFLAFSEDWSY